MLNTKIQLRNLLKSKNIKKFKELLKNPIYQGFVNKQIPIIRNKLQSATDLTKLLLSVSQQTSNNNVTKIQIVEKQQQKQEEKEIISQQQDEAEKIEQDQNMIQSIPYIDIMQIKIEYKNVKNMKARSVKDQTIIMLYEYYMTLYDASHNSHDQRTNVMQLIWYIMTLDNEQFKKEFCIKEKDNIKLLMFVFTRNKMHDINYLKCKLALTKHIQYSLINLELKDTVFENDHSDIFKDMFYNIENRIQNVYSDSYSYLIVHKVSDGSIIAKCINTDDKNKNGVEAIIKELDKNELYDIIITRCPYVQIGQLHIRYLCITGNINYQFHLDHPEDIISLCLGNVHCHSYNDFQNMRNLYTFNICIETNQINNLHNLQRLYCIDTQYISNDDKSMIQQLQEKNKLQYISTQGGDNIMRRQKDFPMKNVRFFQCSEYMNVDVHFNIDIFFTPKIRQLYQQYIYLKTRKTQKQLLANGQPVLNTYVYHFNRTSSKVPSQDQIRLRHIIMFMGMYINTSDWQCYFINRVLNYEFNIFQFKSAKRQFKKLGYNKIIYYLKNFSGSSQQRKYQSNTHINVRLIKKFYQFYKHNPQNYRICLFKYIYKYYLIDTKKQYGSDSKYAALNVLQTFLTYNNEKFESIYGILDYETNKNITTLIADYQVNTKKLLQIKLKLNCKLQYSYIKIFFNEQLSQDELQHDIMSLMFKDVDKRLQRISAKNKMFLAKNINDEKVYNLPHGNEKVALQFKNKFINNKIYDVIIVNYMPENIEQIRMRYLNYVVDNISTKPSGPTKDKYILSLAHPRDLVSLSLGQVKVTNINECINVQNFDSMNNIYAYDVFSNWTKLKIFSVYKDEQINDPQDRHIVNDLFKRNQMIYVNVSNCINMIGPEEISTGLSELQFFYYYNSKQHNKLKLIIKNEFPSHLLVAKQGYRKGEAILEENFSIVGSKNDVTRLKRQLNTY